MQAQAQKDEHAHAVPSHQIELANSKREYRTNSKHSFPNLQTRSSRNRIRTCARIEIKDAGLYGENAGRKNSDSNGEGHVWNKRETGAGDQRTKMSAGRVPMRGWCATAPPTTESPPAASFSSRDRRNHAATQKRTQQTVKRTAQQRRRERRGGRGPSQ